MIELLFAFLSQAVLEEGVSAPLPCPDPTLIVASRTGRFLVVGETKRIHVIDGETLKPLHATDFESTAVGFDEKDETMTLVGRQVVRIATGGWKETFRADLPDAGLRRPPKVRGEIITDLRGLAAPEGWIPGQAAVASDGSVYYRSKEGKLARARETGGKLVVEETSEPRFVDSGITVDGVLTVPPGPTIVRLGAGTGVVLKGRSYGLAGSLDPLAAGARGAEMSVVARKSLGVYSSTTWKSLAQLDTEESRAAVFDAKRGRFYLSRGEELRVWDGAKENQDRAIEGVSGRFHALALDGGAARVYGVEKEKLRSWRVKD